MKGAREDLPSSDSDGRAASLARGRWKPGCLPAAAVLPRCRRRGGACEEDLTGDPGTAGCGSDTTRDSDGAMGRRATGGGAGRRRRVGLTFPSRLGVSCRGSFYWANGPEKWG
uniref:Uncharacterized protein n=1 Tax=Oryza meridionalis TaxID=40149 RepID=A0A0E0ER50_9ORYZ